jgi:hypothetical protein
MSKSNLSPEKLRALVSLYHRSESFITRENLESAIDHAFLDQTEMSGSSQYNEKHFLDLQNELNERRSYPKFGDTKGASTGGGSYGFVPWSTGERSGREVEVQSALYGTDTTGAPGLELLQDEEERIQKAYLEEKRRALEGESCNIHISSQGLMVNTAPDEAPASLKASH